MASNPLANEILLFGGFGGSGVGAPRNDTWRYDGFDWTQLVPATSPTGKYFTAMVYDSTRAVYVLYGGSQTTSGGDSSNQTWEWNGTTWTQRAPASNPGNMHLHAMVFDSTRNRVVLYGGGTGFGSPDIDRTWEYDGSNWTRRFPAANPGPLEAHSMCFHGGVGKTILFGGVNQFGTPPDNDKTWAYDGTNWAELQVTGTRPPRRERASLAYDPARDVCVLVGGMHYSNGQMRSDTWELSNHGATWKWTQVVTPNLPATFYRCDSTLAFLPSTNGMVQFGGLRGTATYFGDTREYQNYADTTIFGAGCAGTSGVPVLRAVDAPRLGQTFTLNIANMNPTLSAAFLVIGFTPLPPFDLGSLLGMPGCSGYLTPDLVMTVSGAGGAASWSWTPVAGAPGTTIFSQALAYDPTVNSFGFTISNAISATIGY